MIKFFKKWFCKKKKKAIIQSSILQKRDFSTIPFNKEKVKIIAHRGLSSVERENTIPAFIAAANRSYYGIESDVYKTSDGRYVMMHDTSTGRLANEDCSINKTPFSKLRELKIFDLDGGFRDDLFIPTLEEYIRICKRYGKTAILELKYGLSHSDIEEITDIIKSEDYLDDTIFISFTFSYLTEVRKLLPKQTIQYMVNEYSDKMFDDVLKYKFDMNICIKSLNSDIIKKLKSKKIKINCFTCDDVKQAEKLVEMGVDFITTNVLE